MFRTVLKVCSLVLAFSLASCTSAHKSTDDDVNSAVLEKITAAVKNQVFFQEIMLDDSVVKHQSKGPAPDKVILAYALHPKYFFWKAKNDPAMNQILERTDSLVNKLNVNLSDVKQVEYDKNNNMATCSAYVTMGQNKMAVKYTVTNAQNGTFEIKMIDGVEKGLPASVSHQPAGGSLSALCTTWETIKPATFPPANPQFIADGGDVAPGAVTQEARLGTLMPMDGVLNGKEPRSYKILQKLHKPDSAGQ